MDERARYFRNLRRLKRSARRWSVFAGTFAGATAVLVPYGGLGWPDAIWAALTGGTAALTFWRWHDLRELAAQPAPPALPAGAALVRTRFEALVARLPAGRNALVELRRMEARSRIRGSSVLPSWTRLDQAVQPFAGRGGRVGAPAALVGARGPGPRWAAGASPRERAPAPAGAPAPRGRRGAAPAHPDREPRPSPPTARRAPHAHPPPARGRRRIARGRGYRRA